MFLRINSPYASMLSYVEKDKQLQDFLVATNFKLNENMIPYISYEEWIIIADEKNEKYYCFDFEDKKVIELNLVAVVKIEDQTSEELMSLHDSNYCGESDDLMYYMYFVIKDN